MDDPREPIRITRWTLLGYLVCAASAVFVVWLGSVLYLIALS